MAFVVKTVKTIRNNWKKSVVAAIAAYYGGKFAYRKYQ